MTKLINKLQAATVLTLAAVSFVSCVNEDYDISEGIDLNVQLLQNTTIPVGNTEAISINTLLGDNVSGTSLFNIAENGDLSLTFANGSFTQTFEVPEVSLEGKGGLSVRSMTALLDISDEYTLLPGNQLAELLAGQGVDRIYFSSEGEVGSDVNGIDEDSPFEIDKELPESVLSIKSINMDAAKLNFVFETTDGAIMHLEKGFIIEFPEYMTLSPVSDQVNYEVLEGHKVVFTTDTELSYASPLVLHMNLPSLTGLEEMVNEKKNEEGKLARYVTADEVIKAYGKVYFVPSDYGDGYIPKNPTIMMDIEMTDLVMSSAELMIDMDLDIADKTFKIGQLPEMFSSSGAVVDVYNPILRFKINNESPLAFDLNAEITSYPANNATYLNMGIPSTDEVVYYFSRQGKHGSAEGTDVALEGLGDIVKNVPEKVSIHDIAVEAERKFVKVFADDKYNVAFEYDFSADMAFGKDLNVAFDYDLDLGFNTASAGLHNLVLSMNMLSSIPLDLKINGVALDENGAELQVGTLDLTLNSGTLQNPVSTPAEIALNTNGADVNIEKLRLKITASSNEKVQGDVLNMNQSLSINDVRLTLPEGITMDLSNLDQE